MEIDKGAFDKAWRELGVFPHTAIGLREFVEAYEVAKAPETEQPDDCVSIKTEPLNENALRRAAESIVDDIHGADCSNWEACVSGATSDIRHHIEVYQACLAFEDPPSPKRESDEVLIAKAFAYRDYSENGLETLVPYHSPKTYAQGCWKDYLSAAKYAITHIEVESKP